MTPHIVKICVAHHPPPPPPPPILFQPLHFISKTLESVNVSQLSQSFKPLLLTNSLQTD